jgi:hypothetical protein
MSAEIEFKLTSIAKTDIASLLDGETIEVAKAYITNAQSGEDIPYVSGLSGTVVFNGVVHGEVLFEKDDVIYTQEEWADMPAGTIPDTGILHVEFFDDSENYYSGKTVAITYRKELEERILCLATVESSADELVVKHFSPLSFALDLRFDNADRVSFENINLSFPPATETRRGSVKVASSADVMSGTGTGVVTSQNLNTRLGDYVTIATTQTITGNKTFDSDSTLIKASDIDANDGTVLMRQSIQIASDSYQQSFYSDLSASTLIPVSITTGGNDCVLTLSTTNIRVKEDSSVDFTYGSGSSPAFARFKTSTHTEPTSGSPTTVQDVTFSFIGLANSAYSRFNIKDPIANIAYFDTHGLTISANKSINFGNTSTYNLSVESVTDTYTSILNNTIQLVGKSLVLYNDYTDETIYTATTTASTSSSFYPQFSFYINDSFYGIPASIRSGSFSLKGKYKFINVDSETQATNVINAYFNMTDISPTTVSTGALQLCAAKKTDSSNTDLEDGDTVIADPKLVLKYSDYDGVPSLEVCTTLADYGNVHANNFIGNLKGNADTATTAETATTATYSKYLTYYPSSGTSTNLIYAASTTSILPIGTSGNIDLGSSGAKFNSIYANSFEGLARLASESFMLSTINAYLSTPARKEVVGVQATSSVIYNLIPAIKLSENNVTTNLGSSSYKWDRLYCNYIGDDSNKVTTVYATNVGNSSNHVSASYINNLYVGSSGTSLSSYIRNELATAISTTSSIGAIRLFCIEFSPDQTVANYIEAGTTFTSSGVTDSGNLTHTPKFATFAASTLIIDSQVNTSIMRCFDHTETIYGTWKLLNRVYVYNKGSYANYIPFLAVRIA